MQEPERVMPTEAHDHDSLEGDDQRSEDERLKHDEEEEEGEDDDDDDDDEADDSALQKAARAGIQLLEENAQLADEVRELQLQLAHAHDQTQEMSRMLDDKEVQMDQLTQHLRESIRENQRLLAELTQAKKETLSYTNLLAEQQQQLQESPRKRLMRVPSPKQRTQQTQQRMRSKSLLVSLEQASIFHTVSTSAMRSDPVTFDDQENQNNLVVASAPVGLNSPRRRQAAAKLDEVEAKYEEEHRHNSVLKIELQSAQRKISELKPLHAQLHEAKEEIQVLRAQMDELEKKLALSWEESAEERELIQSLRTTIEIYQKLDEPNTSIKGGEKRSHYHGINTGDDVQARKLARMRRRKSDGCIFPKTPPNRWTSPVAEGSFQSRDDTNDVILETLDNLAEQLLQLKQPELFPSHIPKSPGKSVSPNISTTDISMDVASVAIRPRPRFVEQQVAVLQDLLKRYRSQWHQLSEKRSAIEIENIHLLSRVEELTRLLQQQCDTCARANESMVKEEEAWQSAATSYETLLQQISNAGEGKMEEDAEVEHACFSILRRLTDSWTADKSKRMHLHDWLTNAIRSTGIRRPLYLPDLTREIASGFEVLLIPILREKFGVQIHVEKRLRNVIVTDLRLQVTETDTEKAQACLQRIRRSLMWLVDVEATQLEDKDWLDEVSRRKAARMCLKKKN
uniref:G protein gamma domain-containing protein n=1 Tax=Globisporangium ultimum (strain ATCC 200006 / CBS 805.95 / DAOM BR144) TaxID=431595 RepID=K3W872_GLOUD